MAHNQGNEYQINVVHGDGTEGLNDVGFATAIHGLAALPVYRAAQVAKRQQNTRSHASK